MKLRTQLLLAGAVILMLPWLGYEYIIELDASLREQQSRALRIQARAAAAIVASNREYAEASAPDSSGEVVFAHSVDDVGNVINPIP